MPRFMVDINVAKLARWLRALGYDTLLLPNADDGDLLRIALQQDRILLTKDSRILERRVITKGQVRAYLVRQDDPLDQLSDVVREFGLNSVDSFTRCMCCNSLLVPARRTEVEGLVPPYVYETQEEFVKCPQCRKVYWKGTHWARMNRHLSTLQERR